MVILRVWLRKKGIKRGHLEILSKRKIVAVMYSTYAVAIEKSKPEKNSSLNGNRTYNLSAIPVQRSNQLGYQDNWELEDMK